MYIMHGSLYKYIVLVSITIIEYHLEVYYCHAWGTKILFDNFLITQVLQGRKAI
jgi:hypothetical protein